MGSRGDTGAYILKWTLIIGKDDFGYFF